MEAHCGADRGGFRISCSRRSGSAFKHVPSLPPMGCSGSVPATEAGPETEPVPEERAPGSRASSKGSQISKRSTATSKTTTSSGRPTSRTSSKGKGHRGGKDKNLLSPVAELGPPSLRKVQQADGDAQAEVVKFLARVKEDPMKLQVQVASRRFEMEKGIAQDRAEERKAKRVQELDMVLNALGRSGPDDEL